MSRYLLTRAACATLVLMAAVPARAAVTASDNSANPAYAAEADGAWKGLNPSPEENPPGTDNGGTGFTAWNFDFGYHQPETSPYGVLNHFIDGVDFPHSTYSNLGPTAFGLTTSYAAFFGTYASAQRPFATALKVGDTFSASIDTPSIYDDYSGSAYPFAIITFQDSTGTEVLKLETGSSSVYGDFNWRYKDAVANNADIGETAGVDPIAPTATSNGSTVKLKVTSATEGQATVHGVTIPVVFAGGLPTAVTFALSDNGSGDNYASPTGLPTGEREFFFDDLLISDGTAIPGDFDGNGHVEGADLTQWKGDVGLNGDSDADGDHDSDGNDIVIWQRHLGEPHATANIGAVPEPTTALLLASAAALLRWAPRGKRRTL